MVNTCRKKVKITKTNISKFQFDLEILVSVDEEPLYDTDEPLQIPIIIFPQLLLLLLFTIISIVVKLYSPRYPVNITFSRHSCSAKSYFSCVVYYILAHHSTLFGVHV